MEWDKWCLDGRGLPIRVDDVNNAARHHNGEENQQQTKATETATHPSAQQGQAAETQTDTGSEAAAEEHRQKGKNVTSSRTRYEAIQFCGNPLPSNLSDVKF